MSTVVIPSIRGGVIEKFDPGDTSTWTVTAGQAATGGRVAEAVAGDRQARTGQAASVVAVGIAIHDAAAGEKVTIAHEGTWMLRANGAVVSGNRLIVAANGEVSAAGATPDARTLIGYAWASAANAADFPGKLTL